MAGVIEGSRGGGPSASYSPDVGCPDQPTHRRSFRHSRGCRSRLASTFLWEGVAGLASRDPTGHPPVKAQLPLAVAEEVLSAPVTDRPNWMLPRL